MLLEMNSIYFRNGQEVLDRKKIMQKYFQGHFFWDMISLLSIIFPIYIGSQDRKKIMGFFFFVKIFGLMKFERKITNRFQLRHTLKCFKNLTILFLVIIFIAHLAACGWYHVASIANKTDTSWIKENDFLGEEWDIKYISSLYWATVTVMTVGYGDITPTNSNERIYAIFVILFGGMIFPFTITSIGNIIQNMQREKKKFE